MKPPTFSESWNDGLELWTSSFDTELSLLSMETLAGSALVWNGSLFFMKDIQEDNQYTTYSTETLAFTVDTRKSGNLLGFPGFLHDYVIKYPESRGLT